MGVFAKKSSLEYVLFVLFFWLITFFGISFSKIIIKEANLKHITKNGSVYIGGYANKLELIVALEIPKHSIPEYKYSYIWNKILDINGIFLECPNNQTIYLSYHPSDSEILYMNTTHKVFRFICQFDESLYPNNVFLDCVLGIKFYGEFCGDFINAERINTELNPECVSFYKTYYWKKVNDTYQTLTTNKDNATLVNYVSDLFSVKIDLGDKKYLSYADLKDIHVFINKNLQDLEYVGIILSFFDKSSNVTYCWNGTDWIEWPTDECVINIISSYDGNFYHINLSKVPFVSGREYELSVTAFDKKGDVAYDVKRFIADLDNPSLINVTIVGENVNGYYKFPIQIDVYLNDSVGSEKVFILPYNLSSSIKLEFECSYPPERIGNNIFKYTCISDEYPDNFEGNVSFYIKVERTSGDDIIFNNSGKFYNIPIDNNPPNLLNISLKNYSCKSNKTCLNISVKFTDTVGVKKVRIGIYTLEGWDRDRVYTENYDLRYDSSKDEYYLNNLILPDRNYTLLLKVWDNLDNPGRYRLNSSGDVFYPSVRGIFSYYYIKVEEDTGILNVSIYNISNNNYLGSCSCSLISDSVDWKGSYKYRCNCSNVLSAYPPEALDDLYFIITDISGKTDIFSTSRKTNLTVNGIYINAPKENDTYIFNASKVYIYLNASDLLGIREIRIYLYEKANIFEECSECYARVEVMYWENLLNYSKLLINKKIELDLDKFKAFLDYDNIKLDPNKDYYVFIEVHGCSWEAYKYLGPYKIRLDYLFNNLKHIKVNFDYGNYSPGEWINEIVKVSFNVIGENISKIFYSVVSSGEECKFNETSNLHSVDGTQGNITISKSGKWKVCVFVMDDENNIYSKESEPIKVDLESPQIIMYDLPRYVNKNIIVKFNVTDSYSGIKEVFVLLKDLNSSKCWNGSSWINGELYIPSPDWSKFVLPDNMINNHIYMMRFKVVDFAGNEKYSDSVTFVYDNNPPRIIEVIMESLHRVKVIFSEDVIVSNQTFRLLARNIRVLFNGVIYYENETLICNPTSIGNAFECNVDIPLTEGTILELFASDKKIQDFAGNLLVNNLSNVSLVNVPHILFKLIPNSWNYIAFEYEVDRSYGLLNEFLNSVRGTILKYQGRWINTQQFESPLLGYAIYIQSSLNKVYYLPIKYVDDISENGKSVELKEGWNLIAVINNSWDLQITTFNSSLEKTSLESISSPGIRYYKFAWIFNALNVSDYRSGNSIDNLRGWIRDYTPYWVYMTTNSDYSIPIPPRR